MTLLPALGPYNATKHKFSPVEITTSSVSINQRLCPAENSLETMNLSQPINVVQTRSHSPSWSDVRMSHLMFDHASSVWLIYVKTLLTPLKELVKYAPPTHTSLHENRHCFVNTRRPSPTACVGVTIFSSNGF